MGSALAGLPSRPLGLASAEANHEEVSSAYEEVSSADAIQTDQGSYLMLSLEHTTVADAMHSGILSCQADATVPDVLRIMATHHVHCIAVLGLAPDESGESLVWGIISDRDVLRAGLRVGADETAGAMAQQPVITVKPTMPLHEAGELMLTTGVNHLVVIDPEAQRPIGILSTLDVAGALAAGHA